MTSTVRGCVGVRPRHRRRRSTGTGGARSRSKRSGSRWSVSWRSSERGTRRRTARPAVDRRGDLSATITIRGPPRTSRARGARSPRRSCRWAPDGRGSPGSCTSLRNQWRRRESNPGPQGIQLTFVHVCSRRIPGGWVRGFGHDLSLADLGRAIEGTLAQPSPVVDALGVLGRPSPWTALRFLRPRERARCRSHV